MKITTNELKPGMTVAVHQRIKEGNKERIQIFEGLIISISNKKGVNHTFTVRRLVKGYGVEKVFVAESPFIEKIIIKKQAKIRRANLSYMRGRADKAARFKVEKYIDEKYVKPEIKTEKTEEPKNEKQDKQKSQSEKIEKKEAKKPEEEKVKSPIQKVEENKEEEKTKQTEEKQEENPTPDKKEVLN